MENLETKLNFGQANRSWSPTLQLPDMFYMVCLVQLYVFANHKQHAMREKVRQNNVHNFTYSGEMFKQNMVKWK